MLHQVVVGSLGSNSEQEKCSGQDRTDGSDGTGGLEQVNWIVKGSNHLFSQNPALNPSHSIFGEFSEPHSERASPPQPWA